MASFKRVLVANRGEIAVRVIRALNELGIESVAVFSDPDSSALHASMADLAFRLPGSFASETYLDGKKLVEVARKANCDAMHPGYGFLSESTEFSKLCKESSIKFVGPSPQTLKMSGNKLECKKLVESRGVPVIPYTKEPLAGAEEAAKFASEIGFPVLLKSAFGGGGKGIREASSKDDVRKAFESSTREAVSSFGRSAVYVEKKLVNPRHVEIQILASDDSEEFVHLGERECSIQRRYQKLVEISPSPIVDDEIRKELSSYAITSAKAVKYSNAGTVEFLRDSATGKFYFIEINSRLQVEHPVTELVTDTDIVSAQIQIAENRKLALRQDQVNFHGFAIECRVNAEDPLADFSPTTGKIQYLHLPAGPGIRVDSALQVGGEISPYYDSLIAKLITFGSDFDQARRRAISALEEFAIAGVKTTISFHHELLMDEGFARGEMSTSFLESSRVIQRLAEKSRHSSEDEFALAALLLSRNQFGSQTSDTRYGTRPQRVQKKQGRFVDAL